MAHADCHIATPGICFETTPEQQSPSVRALRWGKHTAANEKTCPHDSPAKTSFNRVQKRPVPPRYPTLLENGLGSWSSADAKLIHLTDTNAEPQSHARRTGDHDYRISAVDPFTRGGRE